MLANVWHTPGLIWSRLVYDQSGSASRDLIKNCPIMQLRKPPDQGCAFTVTNVFSTATRWIFLAAMLFSAINGGLLVADDFFESQVAPIFQRRCLSCHSGDTPKGDFSLHTAAEAFSDGYIEPGNSAASHLVDLVTPVSGKAAMPKDADPLSTAELNTIQRWIDNGAPWTADFVLEQLRIDDFNWWSYQTLRRPPVPALKDPWAASPIDAFVLQTLRNNGLEHSVAADRRTLIRRVTFDLIGLPPTPDEVDAFLGDTDPQAYAHLVDRLLDSKQYGERWTQHWLDVVKYADTHGYDKDKLRTNAWPYRDYLIRSFNEDKPYARFVQEQVAGDILFPGEPDGILGLGFIAAGPWDFIGHVEVPETKLDGKVARNLDRDDMVSNTMNTFCSVTIQCARCHNHKFDPITQEDYYGMQSLFAAVDRADRPYDTDPQIETERTALTVELAALRQEEKRAAQEIVDIGGSKLSALQATISELQSKLLVVKDDAFGYHSNTSSEQHVEKWVEVDLGSETDIAQIVLRPCHDDFGGIGAGFGFPLRFRVELLIDSVWQTVFDQNAQDLANPGLAPVQISDLQKRSQKVRVTATRLADRKDAFIMAIAELEVLRPDGTNAALHASVASLDSIEAPVRWSRTNLTDGRWAKGGDPVLQSELSEAIAKRNAIIDSIVTKERVTRDEAIRNSIQSTQEKLDSLPIGQMVYAAATKFAPQGNFTPTQGALRPIQVLHRGNIDQPLLPAVPGFLPLHATDNYLLDVHTGDAERRAALAQWLTDKDHPLLWRSIVNRVWQYHFGRGIVETPNDFGKMGAAPSHPELLDWLAVEFRDTGQSLKSLHRMIVNSNVYQQSSHIDLNKASIDGSNQYLWRANRRRLEAEEIRDSILSVSGSLNLQMGGPGFYLFNLEKTEHSPHYEYHLFDPNDTNSHRRSVYRFVVRSQPDPWMTTLDCADSSQSTPRRNETLTSLQALSLLNNPFNLTMAERFADHLQEHAPDLSSKVNQAVRLALQRLPTDIERTEMIAYAQQHGLVNLCRLLFNLSEFVFVD